MKPAKRPMREIYLDAAKAATSLSARATKAESLTKDPKMRLLAGDIALACKRFALKAETAADTILTLLNDGTLKVYCEQFDKSFKSFVESATQWESDLDQIEKTKPIAN